MALLADNGRVRERVWHEPYGTPWGLPAAHLTGSNTPANDDYGVSDGGFEYTCKWSWLRGAYWEPTAFHHHPCYPEPCGECCCSEGYYFEL